MRRAVAAQRGRARSRHGYAERDATIFLVPPGLASTWDPPLVEQAFAVAAREARLRGATVALSPVLDLARDPRYGRVESSSARTRTWSRRWGSRRCGGSRAARGRSRRTRSSSRSSTSSTPRRRGGINLAPADIGERALREAYLVPFEAVIRAADPAVIVPSYNEVGGVPSHANRELLEATGRERLGFRGAYFSDYGGVTNLVSQHRMAATDDDAAVLALTAGVDAGLPDGRAYARLPALVRTGRVPEAAVDSAVARVLRLKFEAGLFEHPYVDAPRALGETNTPADVRLARAVAQRSIVLLKNDDVLPLDANATRRLAVIGPNADALMLGGYAGVNPKVVGILAGVRAAAGRGLSIEYAEGVRIVEGPPDRPSYRPMVPADPAENARRIAAAVEVARRADVVLLVVGDAPEVTRESVQMGAEFAAHFAGLGSLSALAVLQRWPTPAALRGAEERQIRAVLHRASRGHYGAKRAAQKAAALHQAASDSVGLADPFDASATAIRTLIGHLEHLTAQIERLGEQLDALLATDPAQIEDRALLASIPGVGDETQRAWLAEAPPVAQFQAKNGADKLVAHIGIDVMVKQSGRWAGRAKMSKRGNRYLRRALMLAAERAARHDAQFGAIFRRQQLRGKHYRVAVSHVAHKLVHVIYAVLLHRRPYELPSAYRLGVIEPVEPADTTPELTPTGS